MNMENEEMNFDLGNEYEDDVNHLTYGEIVEDITDIDFNDPNEYPIEGNQYNQEEEETKRSSNEDSIDFIAELLKQKGIQDPSAIKFSDDKGNIFEVSFNDLTDEEKLEILSYSGESDNNSGEVSEDVITFNNYLKENNITVDDYVNLRVLQELESRGGAELTYTIDAMSDEQLYVYDLKQRFPNLSDDEVKIALESEQVNESLYNKKLENLRTIYKAEEDSLRAQEEKEVEETQLAAQREFEESLINASKDFKEISVMEMEQADVDAAINVLFQQDASGTTKFVRALNDPAQLLKIAWFIEKGEESINTLVDFYKKEIATNHKENKTNKETTKTQVVIKDQKTNENKFKQPPLPSALKDDIYHFEHGSMNDVDF